MGFFLATELSFESECDHPRAIYNLKMSACTFFSLPFFILFIVFSCGWVRMCFWVYKCSSHRNYHWLLKIRQICLNHHVASPIRQGYETTDWDIIRKFNLYTISYLLRQCCHSLFKNTDCLFLAPVCPAQIKGTELIHDECPRSSIFFEGSCKIIFGYANKPWS